MRTIMFLLVGLLLAFPTHAGTTFTFEGKFDGGVKISSDVRGFNQVTEDDVTFTTELRHRERMRVVDSMGEIATGTRIVNGSAETFWNAITQGRLTVWESRTGVAGLAMTEAAEGASYEAAAAGGRFRGPAMALEYQMFGDTRAPQISGGISLTGIGRADFALVHAFNDGQNWQFQADRINVFGEFEFTGQAEWQQR